MTPPELECRIAWLFAAVRHFRYDYTQRGNTIYMWADAKLCAHLALQVKR